ncbi:MAG: cupin domain-containing protein [Phycisphaeraceae bacterium]|nr:cupin domain-containing protein [Phycisphaeraceae bacterium]
MATKTLYDGSTAQATNLCRSIELAAGGIVSKALLDTPAARLILFSFDAGQELTEHRAPVIATVHVLEGHIELTIADKTHSMVVNDWIVMPANAPHRLLAKEPSRILLTMLKTPTAPGT